MAPDEDDSGSKTPDNKQQDNNNKVNWRVH